MSLIATTGPIHVGQDRTDPEPARFKRLRSRHEEQEGTRPGTFDLTEQEEMYGTNEIMNRGPSNALRQLNITCQLSIGQDICPLKANMRVEEWVERNPYCPRLLQMAARHYQRVGSITLEQATQRIIATIYDVVKT